MGVGLIGRKIGMTRIFDESGQENAVSVIEAGPCTITQVKTEAQDAYCALQLGFQKMKEKHVTKPLAGHFKKAEASAQRHLQEFLVLPEDVEKYKPGQEIKVDLFQLGDLVDVTGRTKGRGFQGVVKRHGYSGLNETHGAKEYKRRPGSMGGSSYPSKVWKGKGLPGRMGNNRKTVQSLKIAKIDQENNLIAVYGAIPGPNNGIVYINKAVKGKA